MTYQPRHAKPARSHKSLIRAGAVVVGVGLALLVAAPAQAKPVPVHWGDTYSGLVARECPGVAWQSLNFGSRDKNLIYAGETIDITCTAQAVPAPAPQAQASGWVHPLPGSSLSSCFGWRSWSNSYHQGLDMSVGSGTPIRAAAAGTVTRAGWIWSGYGISVTINHGGVSTHYAHQSRTAVRVGQWVNAGQTIGYVGSTGYSTGPHLHFEVAQSSGILGSQINPAVWLRNHGVSVGC